MSIYVPAESATRIQVAVGEYVSRKERRRAIRRQLAYARRIGLYNRSQTKLRQVERTQTVVAAKATDGPVVATSVEDVRAAVAHQDEQHFRLADQYLQVTQRHLRKLRHLPAARDALKLVRQAQNLLMDAEDGADDAA